MLFRSAIILRQLEQNQSLRNSNDISRRRRPWNYGRSSASENRRARFGQYISALSDSLLSSDQLSSNRRSGRSENIPFHATRGTQISIGSTFRTARFHNQLRQVRSSSSSFANAIAAEIDKTAGSTLSPTTRTCLAVINWLILCGFSFLTLPL